MNDIVAKLRERPWRRGGETDVQAKERRQKEREEGAAEIERLTARVAELEKALRPLACTCEAESQDECSRSEKHCPFWAARAAITKGERTPSFGDFVEGCDYLPVPSTKGESHD